ncbi:uncharacterized protein LOC144436394 isoform X2 [Glandiceps talaboti]
MSSLLKKQSDSWLILKKQTDIFIRKTNLEVAVVCTFFDKIAGKRMYLTHGTDSLQHRLQSNIKDMVLVPNQGTDQPLTMVGPDLPDIRETQQGCLSKLTFNELRVLIPTIVKCSLPRSQALWGTPDNNYSTENAPVWWPAEVPYCNPCRRPKHVNGWTQLLKDAARACYHHYEREDLTGDDPNQTRPPTSPPQQTSHQQPQPQPPQQTSHQHPQTSHQHRQPQPPQQTSHQQPQPQPQQTSHQHPQPQHTSHQHPQPQPPQQTLHQHPQPQPPQQTSHQQPHQETLHQHPQPQPPQQTLHQQPQPQQTSHQQPHQETLHQHPQPQPPQQTSHQHPQPQDSQPRYGTTVQHPNPSQQLPIQDTSTLDQLFNYLSTINPTDLEFLNIQPQTSQQSHTTQVRATNTQDKERVILTHPTSPICRRSERRCRRTAKAKEYDNRSKRYKK